MEPTFQQGENVIVVKKWIISIKKHDIVVVKDPRNDRLLIKRIKKIKHDLFYLLGDNEKESTDSRHFGWIKKKNIIGKVISKT